MAKRLLLLSNSTNPGEPYLEYPKKSIINFLGNHIKRVLFIPYAGVTISYDDYTAKTREAFQKMGFDIQGIHEFGNPVEAIEKAEAIAVGGGNTFELLNQLYKNDLIEVIRTRVNEGLPYMGWSAGSNIAGPSIKTTNDMPIVEPESFDALNLVPFQLNPHYTEGRIPNHGGESRPDRINEFIKLNSNVYVLGLPEGNLIEVNERQIKLVGKGKLKIFKSGIDVITAEAETDINFVMN
ncbi:MAG: dipeptidase PepE [Cyclobacteriaceae bacterium]